MVGEEFKKRDMEFVGYACVTMTRGKLSRTSGKPIVEVEYAESEKRVRELLRQHCMAPWFMDEKKWLEAIPVMFANYYELGIDHSPEVDDLRDSAEQGISAGG
jgi:hypothetical protein